MKVLSLFDGISCGKVALERTGGLDISEKTARRTAYIRYTGKRSHYAEKLAAALQKWGSIFSDVSRRIG